MHCCRLHFIKILPRCKFLLLLQGGRAEEVVRLQTLSAVLMAGHDCRLLLHSPQQETITEVTRKVEWPAASYGSCAALCSTGIPGKHCVTDVFGLNDTRLRTSQKTTTRVWRCFSLALKGLITPAAGCC
jgi:hypothetical protein